MKHQKTNKSKRNNLSPYYIKKSDREKLYNKLSKIKVEDCEEWD